WRTIARRTGATQECTTVMSPKGHTAERRRGPGWRSHDSRGPSIRHSLAEVSRAVYHESGDKEIGEEITVANYIPSPRQWVREQVELYRSEEHTSELQSRFDLVCRLLLEKKNMPTNPSSASD